MAGFLSEHSGQSERADAIPGLGQKASSMHHGSHPILVDVDKFIEIHEDPCQALQSSVRLCEREQCFFFHGIRPSGQCDLEGVLQALVWIVSGLAPQARRKRDRGERSPPQVDGDFLDVFGCQGELRSAYSDGRSSLTLS